MTRITTPAAPRAAAPQAPAPAPRALADVEQTLVDRMTPDGIFHHVEKLAATPRVGASAEERAAAQYVVDTANAAGWKARIVEHPLSFGRTAYNVVADRAGTAPDTERKLVLAGAHLDSVPGAPGGDDNASGSAMLLELAGAFKDVPTKNDMRLLWFDREEQGLVGSKAYARDNAADLGRAVAMLNADMIAAPHGDVGFSVGQRTTSAVGQAVKDDAARLGIDATFRSERHNRSDHASFDAAGVPSLDFGVGVRTVDEEDPNYHSPKDTIGNANKALAGQFGDLFAVAMNDFANRGARIEGPPPPKDVVVEDGPPI